MPGGLEPGCATNVMVGDMDLLSNDRVDTRRLDFVADGLSLHGGAQLAVDTTLVSPLARNRSAKRGADRTEGAALEDARRRKEQPRAGRSGWQAQVGRPGCGGWPVVSRRRATSCLLLPPRRRRVHPSFCSRKERRAGFTGGVA